MLGASGLLIVSHKPTSDVNDAQMFMDAYGVTAQGTFEGKNILTDSPFAQTGMSGGTGVIGVAFLFHYDLLFDLTNLDRLKTSPHVVAGR